jgi:hypothetical protein
MATFVKVDDFVEQLALGTHDFDTHVFKLALTDTAPTPSTDVSWLVGTTAPAPTAANNYTAGGNTIAVTVAETPSGTVEVRGNETVFTATTGGIGAFRYALLYNDTATTPVDALIGYWDYGSSITLADTETFTATFNATASAGRIFSIT